MRTSLLIAFGLAYLNATAQHNVTLIPGASLNAISDGWAGGGLNSHATIFRLSTLESIDLHPGGNFLTSHVSGMAPGKQVGFASIIGIVRPFLWSGSAQSAMQLASSNYRANDTDESEQDGTHVGQEYYRATLWRKGI